MALAFLRSLGPDSSKQRKKGPAPKPPPSPASTIGKENHANETKLTSHKKGPAPKAPSSPASDLGKGNSKNETTNPEDRSIPEGEENPTNEMTNQDADSVPEDYMTEKTESPVEGEEEKESGIITDAGSELSRQDSSENPELDHLKYESSLEAEIHDIDQGEDAEYAMEDRRKNSFDNEAADEDLISTGTLEDGNSVQSKSENQYDDDAGTQVLSSLRHPHSQEYVIPETIPDYSSSDTLCELQSETETQSFAPDEATTSNRYSLGSDTKTIEEEMDDEVDESLASLVIPPPPEFLPQAPPPPPPPLPPRQPLETEHAASRTNNTTATPHSDMGEDLLLKQIQAAASERMESPRKFSDFDLNAARRQSIPETFTADLQAVICARERRKSNVDYENHFIKGKTSIYQAKAGVPPQDTELGRVFLKRRAAARREQDNSDTEDNAPSADSCNAVVQSVKENVDSIPTTDENDTINEPDEIPQTAFDELDDNCYTHPLAQPENSDTGNDAEEDHGYSQDRDDYQFFQEGDNGEYSQDQDYPKEENLQELTDEITQQDCESVLENDSLPQEDESCSNKIINDFDKAVEEFDDINDSAYSYSNSTEDSPGLSEFSASGPGSPPSSLNLTRGSHSQATSSGYTSPPLSPVSSGCSSPVFEDMDEATIFKSTQLVQEHSKRLAQPLEAYNILPSNQEPVNTEKKPRFSLINNMISSLRNTLGRRKKSITAETQQTSEQASTVSEDGKMKYDENWSMHDTIKSKQGEKHGEQAPRSLRDVFSPYEITSFSEFIDPNQNSGKDFSVRNWKEVLERSKTTDDDIQINSPSPEADDLVRFHSTPNLASLESIENSSSGSVFATNTVGKKSTTFRPDSDGGENFSTNLLEAQTTRRYVQLAPNSTLPPRRHHGMMQSFDSIFPSSLTAPSGHRHYQKKHEHGSGKHSLPIKNGNSLLSPVQRRKQRSQQTRR